MPHAPDTGKFDSSWEPIRTLLKDVLRFRSKGLSRAKVASLLDISMELAQAIDRLLEHENLLPTFRRRLRRERLAPYIRQEREDAVLKLALENLPVADIAFQLKLGVQTVSLIRRELIRQGKLSSDRIPRRARGRTTEISDETLIQLRAEERLTHSAIAERLNVSLGVVTTRCNKLVRQGKVPLRLYGKRALKPTRARKVGETAWYDLNHPLTQRVVQLRCSGATLQGIGDTLGVTRQGAAQILKRIVHFHGSDVLTPTVHSPASVAKQLDCNLRQLKRMMECADIAPPSRPHRPWITNDQLERLREELHAWRTHLCSVCGEKLDRKRRVLCAKKSCQREYAKRIYQTMYAKPLSEVKFRGWYKQVAEQLQQHRLPARDRWVFAKEAKRISGLTTMQLIYLRLRGIVRVRPHPTKTWYVQKSQPLHTYATSEMLLIRNLREEFLLIPSAHSS